MTIFDLVLEVHEKTHMGELEILDRVRKNWPASVEFSRTQERLLVRAIQKDERKYQTPTVA